MMRITRGEVRALESAEAWVAEMGDACPEFHAAAKLLGDEWERCRVISG
jgi:hypothetical protein